MNTKLLATMTGALILATPSMASVIYQDDSAKLQFGGWIGTEYSVNLDDSPFDLGLNSSASRIFFAGENKLSDKITAFGKLEYAVAFSDIADNEFNTRLGYMGVKTPYGTFEAGKVWSPFYDIAQYSDTSMSTHKDSATGAFFAPASEVGGFGRADNSVKYYNQFKLGKGNLMLGLIAGDQNDKAITPKCDGKVTTNCNVTVGTTYGGSLRYAINGFQFGVAHQAAETDGLANNESTINATILGGFYNSAKWMFGGNYTIGKNNQHQLGAFGHSPLVDSRGVEFFAHYRIQSDLKAYVGYNRLTTETDLYKTEFYDVGILKNFDKKFAAYTEYRFDQDSTKNSLFHGDAWSVGMIYFFSPYPHYF